MAEKVNPTTFTIQEIWDAVTKVRINMEMVRGYLSDIYRYEVLRKSKYEFNQNPLHIVVTKQNEKTVYLFDERKMVEGFFGNYGGTIMEFNYMLNAPLGDDLRNLLLDTMNELRSLRDDYERSKEYIQRKWKGWNYDEEPTDTKPEGDQNSGDDGSSN